MGFTSNTIFDKSKFDKLLNWVKLIGFTGGAQVIVQLLGLVSGILVIRLLPPSEYAFYTLANTMLGTMTVLADGGISSGTMAQAGKVWQDKLKLGIVLTTGMDLRKKFAIGSLIIVTPFLIYLLIHHGASWVMSILLLASLIPAFFTALSGTILQLAPKLHQDILPLQRNNVYTNSGRLVLTTLLIFAFPWAFIAIIASGIAQIWSNLNLRKISSKYVDMGQKPDPTIRKEILAFVKRILPGAIYFCVSGQITIWLLSFFGNTNSVAQVGALGRLGMMLGVIGTLMGTLVVPRFSRLPNDKNRLIKIFFLIQLGLALLGVFILGFTYLFPNQILWIIGKDYANLQSELILSIAGSCLGILGGASFSLSVNRGIIVNPLVTIPVIAITIVIGAFLIDATTLLGVLKLNIIIAVIEILMYYMYFIFKVNSDFKKMSL
ncbi:MAG: polysaccharide biosynthesis protein [bacterium]|nr:polysaccharide biosynthesis protein [bacterium]